MLFKILLVAALFGHGYDGALTYRALSCGCGYQEANPIIGWAQSSPAGLVALKGGITAGVTAGTLSLRKHHPKSAWIALAALGAAGWFSAVHNQRLLRGHHP
jgi:hypothetical protein